MDRAPRRLVLVRHAKAESGEEAADHDRRLTSRGERDAEATARWLGQQLQSVDHVWVSSARRAEQTWATLRTALPAPGDVVVDRALYLSGGRDVLEHLAAGDHGATVVVPALTAALATATPLLLALTPAPSASTRVAPDAVPARLREIAVASGCAADYDGWLLGGAA